MKIKEGLSLNEMGDEFVVVADNSELFRGMIKLNKSGAYVFELLKNEISAEDVVSAIVEKYDVDAKTAEKDFHEYLKAFERAELLEK